MNEEKQILKFTSHNLWNTNVAIDMHKGAEIISVQKQDGAISIWAICNTIAEKERREFVCYFTGDYLPKNPGKFLTTIQLEHAGYVLHVFEVTGE